MSRAILSTKYWDADIKTYAFQLRDYGPSIARWLARDPIGEEGGHNLCSFVQNNPVLFCDSIGLVAGTLTKDKEPEKCNICGEPVDHPAETWCECLSLQFERRWYSHGKIIRQPIQPGTAIPARDSGLYTALLVSQEDKCQCIAAEIDNPKKKYLSKSVRMIGSYDARYRGHREMDVDFGDPLPGIPIGGGSRFPRPVWVPPVWPTDIITSDQVSVKLMVEKLTCATYEFSVNR